MSRLLVVVGDALLDRDVDGTAERLCPDAPAPVLAEHATMDRPGGAALAALLATDFDIEVVLVTALAEDAAGARVRDLLADAGVRVYATAMRGAMPEKIRLRADGRVLLRLDRGGSGAPYGEVPPGALTALRGAAAVLVSDYGRGVTRLPALRRALPATGLPAAVPVVWDPHPNGPAAVPGVRLVTPNERELRRLVPTARDEPRLTALARGAAALRRDWRAGAVAVTLGCDGALLSHAGPTPLVVAPPAAADGDSCGAGDSFAVAATAALADGALVSEAVQEAVGCASRYVAAGGASAVRGVRDGAMGSDVDLGAPVGARAAEELVRSVRARGGTVVASGGCFDLVHAGHVATLQAARRLGDCLIVCLNSDASVRAVKGRDRPVVPQADRARLLAALGCVDAVVIFDEPTPLAVLSRLRPDVWVKGGDYTDGFTGHASDAPALPEADLVRRWGGQTVVVPYLAGRSTTRLIAAARRGHPARAEDNETGSGERPRDKGQAT
ncbi:MAG: PfkB family carbohydrate kinase [Micromonosporaceae bacterium]